MKATDAVTCSFASDTPIDGCAAARNAGGKRRSRPADGPQAMNSVAIQFLDAIHSNGGRLERQRSKEDHLAATSRRWYDPAGVGEGCGLIRSTEGTWEWIGPSHTITRALGKTQDQDPLECEIDELRKKWRECGLIGRGITEQELEKMGRHLPRVVAFWCDGTMTMEGPKEGGPSITFSTEARMNRIEVKAKPSKR